MAQNVWGIRTRQVGLATPCGGPDLAAAPRRSKVGPTHRATMSTVTRTVHLLTWLGVIAVPAAGWFVEDWRVERRWWSTGSKTAAACLFIAARIVVHQRWNPRRGHFRYEAPRTDRRSAHRSFVRGFVVVSMAFCAGHGVILWAVLSLLGRNGEHASAEVDWHSVGFGCLSVLILLTIDFVADLPSLPRRSFSAIEQLANRGTSRVLVVHLTLLVGFLGIAVSGASTALFGAFVVLKSLFALGGALPQWEPTQAPEGLSRVLNRLACRRAGRASSSSGPRIAPTRPSDARRTIDPGLMRGGDGRVPVSAATRCQAPHCFTHNHRRHDANISVVEAPPQEDHSRTRGHPRAKGAFPKRRRKHDEVRHCNELQDGRLVQR